MTHILSFHAHPDDLENLGAGTLALLAAKGHQVTVATMTAGDCGSTEHSLEQTAAIRRKEAANAAALIGAGYRCANVGDLCVFNDDPTRRKTVELIRSVAPDIVLTASPADYHPDHEATSVLVRDACFAVSVPNYQTGPSPAMAAIPHLYYMDPIGGRERDGAPVKPNFAVDVAAFMETKRTMLAAHESQYAWVAKQHDIADPLESMMVWTRFRGQTFAVAYAEGFRQYRHHPYPVTPLLQELVGDALLTDPA
ncbi:MAG TPA: PIG-L family deacetylase [Rhizomicrobium sp.]|jgi:LmbE family N-acetylglucosaminyl deacetylase